ncbi:U1 small nuclear ribonucleoprotein of 70kDa MW N terminal-domain-containing protein [Cunninghamella echinulata]|nr:U1 small nuclear ribonucleoprotein of 70kDa MW N terminal-domain-containing protein [Cunninghamella echinulata]
MTDKLPPNLLKLFAPRPPLPYLPPLDKDVDKRIGAKITGIAQYVDELKDYNKDYVPWKSIDEKKKEKLERHRKEAEEQLAKGIENYDPSKDEKIVGDPFHTLFVSHLNYELTEDDIRHEFELYGPIKHLRLVKTPEGKSRGYCFIEFEREKDMKAAYKDSDGMKLLGRRIQVDVERGRTVKNWRPRRLGGGLGNARTEKKSEDSNNNSSETRGSSRERYSDRGSGRDKRGRYEERHSGGRDYDDRRRSRRSRSRSPRSYRDRDRNNVRGRERSRERRRDRDRYM